MLLGLSRMCEAVFSVVRVNKQQGAEHNCQRHQKG